MTMEKIASFTVNHLNLLRGIYLSRKDVTRMPAISGKVLHTIEHLAATFLRNHPLWAHKVIYWGPMGCCTGNYLLLSGDYKPEDIIPLIKETFSFVAGFEGDIPGATPRDCGNYSYMDPEGARREASRFLSEVLENIRPEMLVYPE